MNNDEPEGYKKTELGLLPKEWEVVRLKDVVTTKKGRKPKTLSEDIKKDYLPYLTAEYFRTKRAKQFASTKNESLITVDKEDVVFIWDGSNAGDVFTGLNGVLASTMIKISPKKESSLTRKILYYYLKTKFYQFNTQTTGSTIPHVNKNMFENLLIPLPPLSEQKRITFVLSTIQEAKEKTEDVIKAAKELKKSMMKHLFTYGPVPVEEAENVPLKETELGLLPKDWEVVRLGDEKFFHILESGIDSFSGKKYYLATSSIEGLKLIGIEQEITFNNRPSRANMQPVLNSVWFARMVDTRKVYAFSEDNIEEINGYILSTGFCGIKTSPEVDTAFLKFYFYSDIFNNLKNSLCTGAVQVSLNNTNAKKLLVPLPSLSEQKRIAFALSTVQKAIERTEDVIKATKELKKSMMKHLFTYGPVPIEEAEHVPLKETELGLLPKDWEVVRLKDVVTTKKGRKPKTLSEDIKKDYLPYLTAEYFRTKRAKQFASTKNESLITVDKEDVVFIWDGSNAGDVFTGLNGVLASTMIKISPKKESSLTRKILYYYLKTKFYQFNTQTTGSTIPHVNKNMFENLLIPLPPLSEQKRITFVLSTIQEAKEKTEDVIKAAKELKKSMMKHLFTYGPVPVEEAENVPLKETELGLLPKDWEVVRLGDEKFFHILESGIDSFSGKKYYLATSSIEGLKLIGIEQEITFNNRPSRANMQPVLNSVWFARMVDTRKVYAFSEDNIEEINGYILSTGFCGIKTSPEVDTAFLKFYFYSDIFNNLKNSLCTGAVQVSLNNTNAKKLLVPLPSLSEQKRIAFALSTVQKAIERTEDVIKATKELKKSMMKHLFTYGPVPIEEAEHVPLKETELGLLPKDWEVVRLGDKGHFQYGYTTSATEEDTGTKFLRITDIKEDGVVNWDTVPYGIIDDNLQKFKLFENDILFARIGATTGKACIIEGKIPNAVFASYLIRFISNKELNPKYVFYFTQTREYQELVNAGKEGKLKKGLSATELKNFKIPLPPLSEQKKIASILSAIDQKIEAEENKKRALEDLFKSMLNNLMTAKVRISNVD